MLDTLRTILSMPHDLLFGWTLIALCLASMLAILWQAARAWSRQSAAIQRGYDDAMNWRPFDHEHHDETWRDYRYGYRVGCNERQRVSTMLVDTSSDWANPNQYIAPYGVRADGSPKELRDLD